MKTQIRKIVLANAKAICACGDLMKKDTQRELFEAEAGEALPPEDCAEILRAIEILQQTFADGGCTIV